MSESKEKNGPKKERSFKILLLGDSAVGKTCFIKRYLDDTFQDAYLSTIGFDFKYKYVTLKNGKEMKVQIWDTAGQERVRSIAKSYYKGAQGIILIYDVTDVRSFKNIKNWLSQIKEEASSKICIVLVANKIDCSEKRKVSEEEGQKLADDLDLKIFEASAKDNINVSEAFQEVVEDMSVKYANGIERGTRIKKMNKNEKKKCC